MYKYRVRFFHADRRASSADISCKAEQFFHRHHFRFLVAKGAGSLFEVDLAVARHYADEDAIALASEDKGLEHAVDVFAKAVGHMLGGQVVGVEFVRDEAVVNLGFVEQPGRVCFFQLFHEENYFCVTIRSPRRLANSDLA